MNERISNIFYFGSPKDGFKVYPDPGELSNVFSGYYSNTETDWILIARKSEDIVRYIYVRYGLLTSTIDGRPGSCFGISLDFVNHYFTDLKVVRKEIFEGIWGAILDDGRLLQVEESSQRVAFKSYDLYDLAPYLDEMSKKIRAVIADKKYSNYVRPSYEIPQAGDKIYGLHPDSSPSALVEYFRTSGAIKLSPNLPLETKSTSEKQQEHRENLQQEVSKLTEQLKQKDRELQAVNQKLQEFDGLLRPIRDFSFGTQPLKTDSQFSNSRPINQTHEPLSPQSPKALHSQAAHKPSFADKLSPNTKKIVWGSAIVLCVLVALWYLAVGYFLAEQSQPEVRNPEVVQSPGQPSPTIASREPLIFVTKNGREFGILNEVAFLENARGTVIYHEEDLKEALTSFLFRSSPEVVEIYKGNKDLLWNWIVNSNPNSKGKITQQLNRGSFKIEITSEQQAMLKELVVFIRPL